jgi:tRNA-Thr(GGU) m(6)t(6)A37 methyltransferase TsaA
MDFTLRQIGLIHSPFTDKKQTPIQPYRSQAVGTVEVFSEFAAGLDGLAGFSYIILLYIFDRSDGYSLNVQPFLDDRCHGIFATRYPYRPNPLGLSIVRLQKQVGNQIEISGVDVLDQTPLIDIKPYVPEFDIYQGEIRAGWYESRSKE